MNWNQRQVLVTGAGGFIGSHLSEKLVSLGAGVKSFIKYNSRNDIGLLKFTDGKILDQMEVVTGDFLDLAAIKTAMEGVDIVFHLGALISIPYSYVNPQHVASVNIMGTLNVLTAARELGIKKIIHTSTSEVYGTAKKVPIDENHPLQGQSPYSASKIGADKLAESFFCAFNLPVATIRPFNTYGPRQSARAVIPTIISQTLTKDRITLGSLHPIRDFTFVDDTVNGFIKMAETPNVEGEVVNIGTGQEISVGEIAELIINIIGRNVPIVSENARVRPGKSEVERLVCSSVKAENLLGWKAKTSLEEGLTQTIHWIEKNLFFYSPGRYQI